jgi:hypothetical protein
MLYLDSLDDKPQVLYINSPGGEISPALGIYDTMASLKSQVGTLAFGHAWSIAAFLLAAGAKVSPFLDCALLMLSILYSFQVLFCLTYDVRRRALPTSCLVSGFWARPTYLSFEICDASAECHPFCYYLDKMCSQNLQHLGISLVEELHLDSSSTHLSPSSPSSHWSFSYLLSPLYNTDAFHESSPLLRARRSACIILPLVFHDFV